MWNASFKLTLFGCVISICCVGFASLDVVCDDVSFGSKVRPITFGCVAMGNAVLCILRSRLFVYSEGSGVNRVQVVLSGFSMRFVLFCPGKNFM